MVADNPVTEPRWSVKISREAGQLILVRVEPTARERMGRGAAAWRFDVTLPFSTSNKVGLPSPAENLGLQKIEDELTEAVEVLGESLLVAAGLAA